MQSHPRSKPIEASSRRRIADRPRAKSARLGFHQAMESHRRASIRRTNTRSLKAYTVRHLPKKLSPVDKEVDENMNRQLRIDSRPAVDGAKIESNPDKLITRAISRSAGQLSGGRALRIEG